MTGCINEPFPQKYSIALPFLLQQRGTAAGAVVKNNDRCEMKNENKNAGGW
jgi:hypothetical protein